MTFTDCLVDAERGIISREIFVNDGIITPPTILQNCRLISR